MSFPNIPDITPDINITLEDAVNLLLASIALEEISLANLMDAETSKILAVIKDCENKDCILHDALLINKSVDDTVQNMIKLQMLLQFKLEKVKEIIPTSSTSSTTSTSTSTTTTKTTTTKSTSSTTSTTSSTTSTTTTTKTTTTSTSTTTTKTTTSTTSTCSTTTKRGCPCSLIGDGKGCITNENNEFYNNNATLYSYINSKEENNRALRYYVGNGDTNYCMQASGYNIKIECPSESCDILKIFGKGYVVKHTECDSNISSNVDFNLTIYKKECNKIEFQMEIKSKTNSSLNHESGIVKFNDKNTSMKLHITC